MVKTVRQPTHPAPPGYEEGRVVSEGLRLRTWTLKGKADRAAIVVGHGVGDTLESFTDLAGRLNAHGHTVLLLDFRGHGGSDDAYTTLGGREREDVRAAAQSLRDHGLAKSGLVFMGFSMGAVAVLRAAVDQPDVKAVIAEAPYDTYRNNVAHHAWLLYKLPRWVPIIPIAIAFAGWRAGFDPDEVDAVAASRRLRAPLLAIVDGADDRMPEPVVRRILDAHPGPKRLWIAEGAGHVGASLTPGYWPAVLGFLDQSGI
jgi:pimeloyl-ACP methyl ester carboxylesterase